MRCRWFSCADSCGVQRRGRRNFVGDEHIDEFAPQGAQHGLGLGRAAGDPDPNRDVAERGFLDADGVFCQRSIEQLAVPIKVTGGDVAHRAELDQLAGLLAADKGLPEERRIFEIDRADPDQQHPHLFGHPKHFGP